MLQMEERIGLLLHMPASQQGKYWEHRDSAGPSTGFAAWHHRAGKKDHGSPSQPWDHACPVVLELKYLESGETRSKLPVSEGRGVQGS